MSNVRRRVRIQNDGEIGIGTHVYVSDPSQPDIPETEITRFIRELAVNIGVDTTNRIMLETVGSVDIDVHGILHFDTALKGRCVSCQKIHRASEIGAMEQDQINALRRELDHLLGEFQKMIHVNEELIIRCEERERTLQQVLSSVSGDGK